MASFPPPHLHPEPPTLSPAPPLTQQQQLPGSGAVTLLVPHLPEAISQEMLSRLFSHYGTTSARPCAGGKSSLIA
ncbi:hypothetical protein E2562_020034 [Oryza meyeriana var. granulata]|uniref:RRM domain-containing protein n=1 Tax=Oryza meyeriana var. granulata TaxID=110450 RepID=A0A6G1FAK6_9ORYZ|nr:hypothetical protein E2562_020034 [Oryza meyeriana var. granulata]